VTIGGGVESIGDYAFYYSGDLSSVTIGGGVTSIGENAFGFCNSLASVTFEATSGWHRTDLWMNWTEKTGGTAVDVTDSTANAAYFTGANSSEYWYKL
jgi:hypothetical protein